jgi:hypothetical protein
MISLRPASVRASVAKTKIHLARKARNPTKAKEKEARTRMGRTKMGRPARIDRASGQPEVMNVHVVMLVTKNGVVAMSSRLHRRLEMPDDGGSSSSSSAETK